MNRDHAFSGHEQAEYDSLKAAGRSYYDDLRWTYGFSHHNAYMAALETYGTK